MTAMMFILVSGCAPNQHLTDSGTAHSTTGVDLVAAEAWTIDDAVDPYPEHRDIGQACDPSGMLVEEGLLEVRTGDCGYLIAHQTSRSAVRVGDDIEVLVFHSSLTAPAPAEGHIALTVDGNSIWENNVTIPSISQVYVEVIEAIFDAPEGAEVVLHLHNHGSNAWNLGYVRVVHN